MNSWNGYVAFHCLILPHHVFYQFMCIWNCCCFQGNLATLTRMSPKFLSQLPPKLPKKFYLYKTRIWRPTSKPSVIIDLLRLESFWNGNLRACLSLLSALTKRFMNLKLKYNGGGSISLALSTTLMKYFSHKTLYLLLEATLL